MRSLLALLCTCTAVGAQSYCAPREIIADLLISRGQFLAFSGQVEARHLQIHTNAETGSWTVVMTQGPMACVLGHGSSHTAPGIEGRKG